MDHDQLWLPPVGVLAGECDLLHLVFHRNKNQHRGSRWWRELSILRSSVRKLISEVERVSELERGVGLGLELGGGEKSAGSGGSGAGTLGVQGAMTKVQRRKMQKLAREQKKQGGKGQGEGKDSEAGVEEAKGAGVSTSRSARCHGTMREKGAGLLESSDGVSGVDAIVDAREQVRIRMRHMRRAMFPRCYVAFSSIVATSQFSALGMVLLGVLARICNAVGPAPAAEEEREGEGKTEGVHGRRGIKIPPGADKLVFCTDVVPQGQGQGQGTGGVFNGDWERGSGGHGGVRKSIGLGTPCGEDVIWGGNGVVISRTNSDAEGGGGDGDGNEVFEGSDDKGGLWRRRSYLLDRGGAIDTSPASTTPPIMTTVAPPLQVSLGDGESTTARAGAPMCSPLTSPTPPQAAPPISASAYIKQLSFNAIPDLDFFSTTTTTTTTTATPARAPALAPSPAKRKCKAEGSTRAASTGGTGGESGEGGTGGVSSRIRKKKKKGNAIDDLFKGIL